MLKKLLMCGLFFMGISTQVNANESQEYKCEEIEAVLKIQEHKFSTEKYWQDISFNLCNNSINNFRESNRKNTSLSGNELDLSLDLTLTHIELSINNTKEINNIIYEDKFMRVLPKVFNKDILIYKSKHRSYTLKLTKK